MGLKWFLGGLGLLGCFWGSEFQDLGVPDWGLGLGGSDVGVLMLQNPRNLGFRGA